MTAATTQQLQRLTAAMDSLKPAIALPPAPARPSNQPRPADAAPPQPSQPPPPSVPRKPCPRCGQTRHWARDCIQPPQQPPAYRRLFSLWAARSPISQVRYLVKPPWANASAERWSSPEPASLEAHPQRPAPPGAAYLLARISGRRCRCLLDSGADVSLIPTHLVNRECLNPPSSNNVFAANDTEIIVDGHADLAVVVETKRYSATFLASANVDKVILGRDWLTQNQVVWDFHSDSVLINGQKVDLVRKHSNSPRCKRCATWRYPHSLRQLSLPTSYTAAYATSPPRRSTGPPCPPNRYPDYV